MANAELHQLLINTVTHEHDCVLQYDSQHQALKSWLWPKENSGTPVAPEDLREHRTSRDFLGPCCLCPALPGDNTSTFVEAAMYNQGDGQFVATCPTDSCGYVVFLSSIFQRGNMPTTTYVKREGGAIEPPRVYHLSEDVANVFRGNHFYGINCAVPTLPPTRRVLPRPVKYHDLLLKLDSRVQPGIPENLMKLLFVRCAKCGKVTTRRVFLHHGC